MMLKKIQVLLCSLMLLAAAAVVVLGAFTRLADAGLGCPDWPTCYGHIWVPNTESEIARANALFQDTPVETDKTWPEQTHRLFATNLGTMVLIFFALSLVRERKKNGISVLNGISVMLASLVLGTVARIAVGDAVEPFVWGVVLAYFGTVLWYRFRKSVPITGFFTVTSLLAGLVIVQGLFGMWTVTLKLWPQVVTAHLLGGFATITLIAYLWTKLVFPQFKIEHTSRNIRVLAWSALIILLIQITLGGWTTSNYAALACPDLPTCQNAWWPDADFVEGFNVFQSLGPNYLGGQLDNDARVAIHLSHRIGAICVLFILGAYAVLLMRGAMPSMRLLGASLATLLCIQIGLGLANILFALPLMNAVAHNAVGAVLLSTTFISLCCSRYSPQQRPEHVT